MRRAFRKIWKMHKKDPAAFNAMMDDARILQLVLWDKITFAIADSIRLHTNIDPLQPSTGKCSSLIAEYAIEHLPTAIESFIEARSQFAKRYFEVHGEEFKRPGFIQIQTFDHMQWIANSAQKEVESLRLKKGQFVGRKCRQKRAKLNKRIAHFEMVKEKMTEIRRPNGYYFQHLFPLKFCPRATVDSIKATFQELKRYEAVAGEWVKGFKLEIKLENGQFEIACASCGKVCEKWRRCPCKEVFYCSRTCRNNRFI